MMQNWSPFHQAGCSSLWTNQRPPPENSNCGEKQLLHWVNKYHKIWVGCCNYVLGLIRYESRMVPEHADTISTPENWLQNLFGLHRRCVLAFAAGKNKAGHHTMTAAFPVEHIRHRTLDALIHFSQTAFIHPCKFSSLILICGLVHP